MDRRRLHTLSGVVLLGAFLVEHLLTNASVLGGAASFDRVVGTMARSSLVAVFEVVFVLIPLGYHAINGLLLLRRPAVETEIERYGVRRFWILQRISAALVFVFVLVHVWELRLQRLFFGLGVDSLFSVLSGHLSSTWAGVPIWALFYLFGIAATCVHFGNGASAALGPRFRRVTLGFAGLLFTIGTLTLLGFATGTTLFQGSEPAPGAPCGSAVPISSSRP